MAAKQTGKTAAKQADAAGCRVAARVRRGGRQELKPATTAKPKRTKPEAEDAS